MTVRRSRTVTGAGESGRIERRALLLLLGCLLIPMTFGSCAPVQTGAGLVDDPPGRVDWAMLGGPHGSRGLPPGGTFTVALGTPRPPGPPHVPEDKLHEQLRALVLTAPPGTQVEVLVTFRDTLRIPRFPERVPSTSPKFTDREQAILNLITQIQSQRSADYDTLDDSLAVYGTIHDRDAHWLLRAMVMEVPVENLVPLAMFPQVVYVQPRFAGEPPPAWPGPNTMSTEDPKAARDLLHADPYFASYGANGTIGLVDTGVYTGHQLLVAPDIIGEAWNCLSGTCVQETGGLWEACPTGEGHGTGSAALLSGNQTMGADHRGFTRATVHAYKAYKTVIDPLGVCSAQLDGNAAALGIQKAVARGDRVILAETQSTAPGWAAIAQEADRAYRAGAVVIAPVGNLGLNVIGSPANARGAIAVGAYDVKSQAWSAGSSYGVVENRYKPDLEAPTGCETASGPAANEMTWLSRTSGAGPTIAGASLLLRNFMMGTAGSIDAGKIYAALILGGTETANFGQHGAGHAALFEAGDLIDWGKIDLHSGTGQILDLIVTDPATQNVAAAVWWPENLEFDGLGYPLDTHNDVEIELYPPNSTVPVTSTAHFDGVFERIVANVSGRVGTWKLHVIPRDFVTTTQKVFWATGLDPVTPPMAIASQTSTGGGGCGCAPGGCSP